MNGGVTVSMASETTGLRCGVMRFRFLRLFFIGFHLHSEKNVMNYVTATSQLRHKKRHNLSLACEC